MSKKIRIQRPKNPSPWLRFFEERSDAVPTATPGTFPELDRAREQYRQIIAKGTSSETTAKNIQILEYELRWLMEHRYQDFYKPCLHFGDPLSPVAHWSMFALGPNHYDCNKAYVEPWQIHGGVGAAHNVMPLVPPHASEEMLLDVIAYWNLGRLFRTGQLETLIRGLAEDATSYYHRLHHEHGSET
jgi:hypothetical protein